MAILNKAVLLMSMVLMAQSSLAGSLTITTKDQDGQTRTVVEETYDTPVYSKPIKPPTKSQHLQSPSTSVITEKQADQELAQKVAHEERLLGNRIADYKRLEAERIVNTYGGVMIYDVYGPKIRILEKKLKDLRKDPRRYFRHKSKHDDLDTSLNYRPSNYQWPYLYAPPPYSVITKGAGFGSYQHDHSASNLSFGLVPPSTGIFGPPRPYKWEDDPNILRYDGSHD